MIHGIGIDLVHKIRMSIFLEDNEKAKRIFTEKELSHISGKTTDRILEYFAARFAVKEAVLKAWGKGLRSGYTFTDIETINDAVGKPIVYLNGKLKADIEQINAFVHCSISHDGNYAMAYAIIETQ